MLAIVPDYEESSSDDDEGTSASHVKSTPAGQMGHQELQTPTDHTTVEKSKSLSQGDESHSSNTLKLKTNLHLCQDNLMRPLSSVPDGSLEDTAMQGNLTSSACLSKSNENYVKVFPESKDEANCSFKAVSRSGGSEGCNHLANRLNSEQESVIRFLALKRRKDEEMKQLEMVKEPPECQRRKRHRRKRKGTGEKNCKPVTTGDSVSDSTSEMQELTSYIGVNDHLKGSQVDHGNLASKSGLEKKIDQAISRGDVDKAEELSDYLAKRNFAVRVAEAVNARDYDKCKQEKEKEKLAKKKLKKSKLAWGFEVKHRWEMKGNM